MSNAREFLNNPPEIENTVRLREQLKADPALRRQFLIIATDQSERFNFRTRSLMVLARYTEELDASEAAEIAVGLLERFQQEFSSERLTEMAQTMRSEECTAEAFIAHLFCIVFATLSPERTQKHIDLVQQALRGTSLGATLTKHLNTIGQQRRLKDL